MVTTPEELEDVGAQRQAAKKVSINQQLRNSGSLQGFNDPATRAYRPLADQTPSLNSEPGDDNTARAFRAGTVEAQQRQQQEVQPGRSKLSSIVDAGRDKALAAGAEAVVSKLGVQGFVLVTVLNFLRKHKIIANIVLFLLGASLFFNIGFVIIVIYYAIYPCEAVKLPLPSFTKIVLTLTNLRCVLK